MLNDLGQSLYYFSVKLTRLPLKLNQHDVIPETVKAFVLSAEVKGE